MIPTKILSQRPILHADLFTVVETQLDIKGTKRTHLNVYRPSIASVFPIADDGEIYLIKQYRYLHGQTFLEEVAGHVEKDESPLFEAKRELREEVGITAGKWTEFAAFSGTSSVIKTKIYLFLATDLRVGGAASPEEDEEITLVKMPLEEAVKRVLRGQIKNSIASLGILMLHALRQKGGL
ncbi:MAG: NUDIX hydrolase [Candidatus Levybacteria bacterium]|nr:NUDIX hydrolase [Candidatus Levybacteria bacterium]